MKKIISEKINLNEQDGGLAVEHVADLQLEKDAEKKK